MVSCDIGITDELRVAGQAWNKKLQNISQLDTVRLAVAPYSSCY